eukprot:COSAG06_NODE_20542_length_792_cov_0.779221_1_plen_90_part_00
MHESHEDTRENQILPQFPTTTRGWLHLWGERDFQMVEGGWHELEPEPEPEPEPVPVPELRVSGNEPSGAGSTIPEGDPPACPPEVDDED